MSTGTSTRTRRRADRYVATAGEQVPAPRVRGFAELESSKASHLRRISDLETQIGALQAEQVRRGTAYVRDQLEHDQRLGMPVGEDQHRVMVAEVAVARRVSNLSASSWLSDAFHLDDALPFTLAALERGELSLWSARTIGREIGVLDDVALVRLADEAIAMEAAGLLPGKIKALAQTRVLGIDPTAAAARANRARADRYVTASAGEPGAAYLTASLPAEEVAACWNALNDHATAVYADGDPQQRSVSQIITDTFVERLTGITNPTDIRVRVDLVMAATTLFGVDDLPGQLVGVGPIPAEVARLIAETGNTWIRRLYTDPIDGSGLLADTRRRFYRGKVRDTVLTRDRGCRGPQCATRVSDIDHLIEHATGGPTSRHNAQALSKGCHTMRNRPDVTVTAHPNSNAITWTLPSGATTTTLPPPALGHGSSHRTQIQTRQRLTTPRSQPRPRRPLRQPLRR